MERLSSKSLNEIHNRNLFYLTIAYKVQNLLMRYTIANDAKEFHLKRGSKSLNEIHNSVAKSLFKCNIGFKIS